jgi:alcohol dehydrogenase class IV
VFGRGVRDQAAELVGDSYVVLTTPRARNALPGVLDAAATVHEVPPGRVDELAGALRDQVSGDLLVALGGGRVIDVAKALAAALPPCRVAAIPTTLSGAEMTAIHRHAAGVPAQTPRVRPAIVLNDPELSASQPADQLALSAANALGHAAEGPITPLSNPVARMAGLDAAQLLARGSGMTDPDDDARDSLALGALLAGYVIGSTGYGLHHVLSQTLARFTPAGHGAANALMLPHSLRALRARSPAGYLTELEAVLGADPVDLAVRLRDASGLLRLRDAGVAEQDLERCAEEAARRPELNMTPPPADLGELRALYEAAY